MQQLLPFRLAVRSVLQAGLLAVCFGGAVPVVLGAQIDVAPGQRWPAVLQLVSEQQYDHSYRPAVERVNVKWQAAPELAFRAGRIALPLFLGSDYRKVGYIARGQALRGKYRVHRQHANVFGFGIDYDPRGWFATAEANHIRTHTSLGRISGRYASTGYQRVTPCHNAGGALLNAQPDLRPDQAIEVASVALDFVF